MMSWILLAIFLIFLCAILLVAEVFVPSGGMISLAALGCLIGGIGLGFKCSAAMGGMLIGAALVLIPLTLILAYRILPKTRFGKAVTLEPPERELGDGVPDSKQLAGLLGTQGTVVTPLHPVGICDFSGLRVECVVENGYVYSGQSVEVIQVQGSQVTVRRPLTD